jgi:hypothetical protein
MHGPLVFATRFGPSGEDRVFATVDESLRALDEIFNRSTDSDGSLRRDSLEMLTRSGLTLLDLDGVATAKLIDLLKLAVRQQEIGLLKRTETRPVPGGPALPPEPPTPPTPPRPRPAPRETTFIVIEALFDDGTPYTGAYRIKLPNGNIEEGNLGKGVADIRGIDPPGDCEISFPDLDAAAWSPA